MSGASHQHCDEAIRHYRFLSRLLNASGEFFTRADEALVEGA